VTSQRALQPQDQISHYRIVGPLGAGGMGEVYLAQDQTLERNVALKILPPELVRSEERVRRFVREAKSASSLNHPNIVTIYEIGQDEVRGSEGAGPPSSAVHYISMELVSGETLSTKIHQDKTDLRTLLGYLAQAAEGLAKAHAAGIVHRDLKPGNIMVSKDGFAKVLDFGLAKLTEKGEAEADVTVGPTEAGDGTSAGAILGTVGYMAPEQVRGASVDHRADIFSFGCILYEAVTRKRPFVAESGVETMHKILHEKPVDVAELNPAAPAELRRLIRRCLAKNPEQRLQSAKDLALELREIVDEYETLSPSGSSGSGSAVLGAPSAPGRKRIARAVLVASAVVVAGATIAGVLLRHKAGTAESGAPPIRISTITSRGSINGAAISHDGRYIAYSMLLDGVRTLWVRQVATGSDVQILPAQPIPPTGLVFAPGGDYLYYQSADPDRDGYTAIFEIPTLGGNPRKRAYDVDSRVTFSPDGKQIAFRRGEPHLNRWSLVVRDVDSGKERNLASVSPPVDFGQPAWSPDGKRIAIVENRGGKGLAATIACYRVSDGRREPIERAAFVSMDDIAWLPDGRGLIASAFDAATLTFDQLWRIGYPDGQVTRLTSDASNYLGISVSGDGSAIAAARFREQPDLWMTTPFGARDIRQITFGSGEEGAVRNFDEGPDSMLLYETVKDGSAQIVSVPLGGATEHSLTEGQKVAVFPFFRPGSGIIYVRTGDELTPHIWRMDANGENAKALTSGGGEWVTDVSRDGRTILFYSDDNRDVLWSVSPDGGAPVRLAASANRSGVLSPDGARVYHSLVHEIQGQGAFTPEIIPVRGGPGVTAPVPPRAFDVHWGPDGASLTYLHNSNGLRNVYRVPLDGGPAREITHFSEGRIFLHSWSPDGKRLVMRRKIGNAENLWVVGAEGENPVPVTDFETGTIPSMKWSRDGSRIFFTYGVSSQNVVLIRNFNRKG
jgi:serine/threonine protein kinase/Tol biopolymer transport system component